MAPMTIEDPSGADTAADVQRLMWNYESLSEEEMMAIVALLPRKVVRWLGTNHPDNRTRKLFFRATGVRIGKDAVINANVTISDSYRELVTIGDRASLSPGVTIIADAGPNNSRLQFLPYVRDRLIVEKAVVIGDDAWIGANAVLLPGVVIGEGAIVGAGSVVSHSAPPYTIVAGVPAKMIRALEKSPKSKSLTHNVST